jgi:hypothetical protein
MLAGGAPIPTGKKTSWPEQSIPFGHGVGEVGEMLGTPFVVKVVCNTVVEVVEYATATPVRLAIVVAMVAVLSDVIVSVDPLVVIETS